MATKRFAFGKKELSTPEKYINYVEKYKNHLNQKEEETKHLNRIYLESLIYQSSDYNEVADRLLEQVSTHSASDIDWKGLTQEKVGRFETNVNFSQSVANIKIHSAKTQSIITEDQDCIKTWQLEVTPSEKYPEVKLEVSFKALSPIKSQESPSIHCVKIKVSGLETEADILPVIKQCEEESEIQLFIMILTDYLELCNQRREKMEAAAQSPHVSIRKGEYLEFKNSDGRALVFLRLKLEYSQNLLGWVNSWQCKFTDTGLEAAESFNFPEQLLTEGHCEDWSVEHCVETLTKLSSLATSSDSIVMPMHMSTPLVAVRQPVSSTPSHWPVPNLPSDTDETFTGNVRTPLNSQPSQRPPKRRLN